MAQAFFRNVIVGAEDDAPVTVETELIPIQFAKRVDQGRLPMDVEGVAPVSVLDPAYADGGAAFRSRLVR